MMQKKIIPLIGLYLSFSNNINAAQLAITQISECPDVILCRSGDNSKQTYTASVNNQQAYQCYYKFGDTDMAKIASKAMINCQTMYGSINPTLR